LNLENSLSLVHLENKIKSLKTFSDIRTFISKDLPSSEDDLYDFKVQLPPRPEKTAVLVTSFANNRGGYIIVGVTDDRKPVGIPKDNGLLTKITDTTDPVSPTIPSKNIEITKSIEFGRQKRYIYFIIVRPSLSTERPHFYKQRIPIRQNGKPSYINSGRDLRAYFFPGIFDPWNFKQMDVELELIKNFMDNKSQISIFYFRSVQKYLSALKSETLEQGKDPLQIIACIKKTQLISLKIGEIENYQPPKEIGENNTNVSKQDLETALANLVDSFLHEYRRMMPKWV